MGMNVGSGGGAEPEVMMDINTTPLIDVMLVLIIMRIGGGRRRAGQVERHLVGRHRDGDDEHDQQHQHHVDQGGRVDVTQRGIVIAATHTH